MPTLQLSKATATRTQVTVTAEDGSILENYQANLTSQRAQKKLTDTTRLPLPEILTAISQANAADKGNPPVELTFAAPGGFAASGPFSLTLRGRQAPKETAITFERETPEAAVLAAFDYRDCKDAEPIIEWEGTDRLCCLDIDYHGRKYDDRPSFLQLECRAGTIHPRPFAFHCSHGRGMKMFYAAASGYTASELAAVAALGWLNQDRRATADLVHQTRHPAYVRRVGDFEQFGGEIITQVPGDDLQPLARWLMKSVDPDAVEDWLAARNWKKGESLPHTDCPINPCPSHGNPVYVGDDGIYCQRCNATGDAMGFKAGWVPYSSLVGGVSPKAAAMIRHAVHWTHARLILRNESRLGDTYLQAAYSAAIKLHHGTDSPAASAISYAGRDMIRMAGRWVSPDGCTTYTQNLHGLIDSLPAVWLPGSKEVLRDRRDLFLQPGDLSHYGYFDVTPVHGATIYGHHMRYPDGRVAFATPAPAFRVEGGRFAPKYRKDAERMPLDEAWGHIEQVFPHVNRRYVQLLIAMKGLAEGGSVQAPFTIVTGPTSSAKSATVHLAASICGDAASEPLFTADNTRLMQAIASGLDNGSFVVLNEVFKEAERAKMKPRQALDPILTLTPAARSHRLYIGPRPLGRLPALVLTDVEIPLSVQSDQQLARRLIWVEQQERVEWNETVAKAGFGEIGRFRLHSPEAAKACDAILSHVIDEYFRHPMTVRDVAKDLGFGTLEDCGLVVSMRDVMRRFFFAVLAAPDLTGRDATRVAAPGWKAIRRGDAGDLNDLWEQLANGLQGEEWKESRIAKAEDWTQLLGCTSGKLAVEISSTGSTVLVRFTGRKDGESARDASWVSSYGVDLPPGVAWFRGGHGDPQVELDCRG